ncbi:hypothetical protein ES705_14027 [subsurface metagenome]
MGINTLSIIKPKYLFPFFLFAVVFFTYGGKEKIFYFNWLSGAILIYAAIHYCLSKLHIKKTVFVTFFLMCGWIGYAIILTPLACNTTMHLKYIIVSIFYISISVILATSLSYSIKRFLLVVYWLDLFWISINGIFYILYLVGFITYEGSFSGICHNRNQFAVLTSLLANIAFFYRQKYQVLSRTIIKILLFLSLGLVVLSLSLKGILGFLFLYVAGSWFTEKKCKKAAIIIVLGIIVALVMVNDSDIQRRFSRFLLVFGHQDELRISQSPFRRLWFVNESLRITAEHPLTGIGVNNSMYYLLDPYTILRMDRGEETRGVYSHNNYTEMLLNGGIPAFLLYYIPIVLILIKLLKNFRLTEKGKFCIVILAYKLFMDIGMVSYFDFSHTFIIALAFVSYFHMVSQKHESFLPEY